MNKYGLLLRMQLYNSFGINRMLHSHETKEKKRVILSTVSGILISALLIFYSAIYCLGLAITNLTNLLPAISVLLCSVISLFVTLMKGVGVLFGMRDYDMVMSLPVSSFSVVTSRLTASYLLNIGGCLLFVIPAAVIFSIFAHPTAGSLIMFLCATLFLPVIPMILAMAVGALITVFSSRTRHSNVASIILNFAFVLLIMFGSMQISSTKTAQFASISNTIGSTVNKIYPPAILLTNAVNGNHVLPFLGFAALSILLGAIFIFVIAHFYQKLNAAFTTTRQKASHKTAAALKTSTPFGALYRRELHQFFSCTSYVLNATFGMVLLLIAAVMLQFFPIAILEKQMGMPAGTIRAIQPLLPLVPGLFAAWSCSTSASLSLEGKSRWILCSIPVQPITIFNAKSAVNLTLSIPALLVSAILLCISLHPSMAVGILTFLIPILYAFFTAVFGMFLNVKFPNYDWTSTTNAVKNGTSVMISTFSGMAVGILPLIVCTMFPEFITVIIAGISALLILITVLLYHKLKRTSLYA